jgi:hypothetical protein
MLIVAEVKEMAAALVALVAAAVVLIGTLVQSKLSTVSALLRKDCSRRKGQRQSCPGLPCNLTKQSTTREISFYLNYGFHPIGITRHEVVSNPHAEDRIQYLLRLQEAVPRKFNLSASFFRPFGAKPSKFNGSHEDHAGVIFWLLEMDTYIEQQTMGAVVSDRQRFSGILTFRGFDFSTGGAVAAGSSRSAHK